MLERFFGNSKRMLKYAGIKTPETPQDHVLSKALQNARKLQDELLGTVQIARNPEFHYAFTISMQRQLAVNDPDVINNPDLATQITDHFSREFNIWADTAGVLHNNSEKQYYPFQPVEALAHEFISHDKKKRIKRSTRKELREKYNFTRIKYEARKREIVEELANTIHFDASDETTQETDVMTEYIEHARQELVKPSKALQGKTYTDALEDHGYHIDGFLEKRRPVVLTFKDHNDSIFVLTHPCPPQRFGSAIRAGILSANTNQEISLPNNDKYVGNNTSDPIRIIATQHVLTPENETIVYGLLEPDDPQKDPSRYIELGRLIPYEGKIYAETNFIQDNDIVQEENASQLSI